MIIEIAEAKRSIFASYSRTRVNPVIYEYFIILDTVFKWLKSINGCQAFMKIIQKKEIPFALEN